jgi:hypothetical protein
MRQQGGPPRPSIDLSALRGGEDAAAEYECGSGGKNEPERNINTHVVLQ